MAQLRELRAQEMQDISEALRRDLGFLIPLLDKAGQDGASVVAQVFLEFGRLLAQEVLFAAQEVNVGVFNTKEAITILQRMDAKGWELPSEGETYGPHCEGCPGRLVCPTYQEHTGQEVQERTAERPMTIEEFLDALELEDLEYSKEGITEVEREAVSLSEEEDAAERQVSWLAKYNKAIMAGFTKEEARTIAYEND